MKTKKIPISNIELEKIATEYMKKLPAVYDGEIKWAFITGYREAEERLLGK